MNVYIAFALEAWESPVLVGVFATPAAAHTALGAFLAERPEFEGRVEARTVHE